MTIHVPAAELHARIDELLDAVQNGEEVVIEQAGAAKARLIQIVETTAEQRKRIAERRVRALGMFEKEFEGYDLSLESLKAHRSDPEERFRRKFADPA